MRALIEGAALAAFLFAGILTAANAFAVHRLARDVGNLTNEINLLDARLTGGR